MDIEIFVLKVIEMRKAQKQYFKGGRLHGDLIKAKNAEAMVDHALAQGIEYPTPTAAIASPAQSAEQEHQMDLNFYHQGETEQ